jgi:hypothetical protein
MPKPAIVRRAPPRPGRPRPADLPNAVEGQIAEICRDLAVEAKRMRQLQEQADELRTVIHQWANPRRTRTAPELIVEDDAEQ